MHEDAPRCPNQTAHASASLRLHLRIMSFEEIDFLDDGPPDAATTFLFAHGAGAPMDSQFMNDVAAGLGDSGIRVRRFEFPYMAARRQGLRRGPDRSQILMASWRNAIESSGGTRLFIGGKSLGGRMATMVDQRGCIEGIICFGYPFHPPGQPQKLRTAHLATITTPVLILQGERDPFGTREEVETYELSSSVTTVWLPDGDHSLKPRKKSGHTRESNLELAIASSVKFMTP